MYNKVETNLNFVEREKKILSYWKENNIFKKSLEQNDGKEVYTFYDGPPTANGKPHIGHVLTRAIKDVELRYRTMKGFDVLKKAGWDTHGLPVELEVEKLLGLDGKEQIEKYGLEHFITKCKESVWKYKGMWEDFSELVGFWCDMEEPYVTYDNTYIESEWWALKQIWEKGLLYKGYKIVPYCPRCGTPLSSHEVAQGYKDVKERSAIAKFKIKDTVNEYFLAWTTTPWTLPSNVALCVNPEEEYVKVKCEDVFFILAKALVDTVLVGEYEIVEIYKGKDLEYKEYEPLFDFITPQKKAYYVTCDTYVTLTDGTGIVHIAPAFGEDDSKIGYRYDLPFVQLVDTKGEMTEETAWAGVFCKKADPEILKDLDSRGLLFSAPKFEHSYPHCWRCDTPLIYYARDTWFIKMTAVRDDLVANNNKINWYPENVGKGRFGDWIQNVQDWGISRDRYWGTPLNIWECECGHRHSIGSIEELKSMSDNCPHNIELHRPYIDDVLINCPKCNKKMKRVSVVVDCWFDSGAMPFAQWHYPFENKDLFEKNFPADFITEAIDQTRGWFYSLMAESTLLFNEPAFKNVIVMGHVQDANGQKLSKSKGNSIDPFEILNEFGADAVRWYFYSNSAPWLSNRFSKDAVIETQRKFMGTLWNTYAFFVLYANIDNFDPYEKDFDMEKLAIMDKWILSKLNTLIKFVDQNMNAYKITECARAMENFTDDLSNWYVRRCRERFWVKDMTEDKANAYMTLYKVLTDFAILSAPFIPFMSEQIYTNLVLNVDNTCPKSVHLCDYPEIEEEAIDKELENNMNLVLQIVVQGRAARNTANIKNRQPIGNMYIKSEKILPQMFVSIIADELNIKNVVFTNEVKEFTTYKFKPQLRTLGPKYGKLVSKIANKLNEFDGNDLMDKFNIGTVSFEIDTTEIVLTKDDVIIEATQKEGFIAETDRGITVIIDTNLSDELTEEGFVREIISKLQTMRKEAGFEVQDYINVYYTNNEAIAKVIVRNREEIKSEVLGEKIIEGEAQGYTKEWNINGEKVIFTVVRK